MKVFSPQYYSSFHCIAGACPDSCCKDWIIDVDNKTAEYYRTVPGGLGDRLRHMLAQEDGNAYIQTQAGKCPMWEKDGMCGVQNALGHDALCETCRAYPRIKHEYGDFTELGLELSCPEAARLILNDRTYILTEETVPGGEPGEYDTEVMAILQNSRREALCYLANTERSPNEALAILLLYAHGVQDQIDGEEEAAFSPETCLASAKACAGNADTQKVISLYQRMEILTSRWRERLNTPDRPGAWTRENLALAAYFINRYWLQAVSDYDLIGRVKFIVASCLLIRILGGDLLSTAQLYSKEIENDAENIDAILDGAYTDPALTDENLLGLLLGKA